jgi:hypothetical protein
MAAGYSPGADSQLQFTSPYGSVPIQPNWAPSSSWRGCPSRLPVASGSFES